MPWHSHDDRPALIFVAEGEIVEYASNCAVPIVHKAGEIRPETKGTSHWWQNQGRQDRRALCRRHPARQERQAHVTARGWPHTRHPWRSRSLSPAGRHTSFPGGAAMARGRHMAAHSNAMRTSMRPARCCAPLVIGLTAFLTLVDLFATQAILPSLTSAYGVTPGRHGLRGERQHLRHGGRGPRASRSSAGTSIGAPASWSASRSSRSRPRCSRRLPTSRRSRCCASRRGSAWHRPSR